jgi:hypothetical protein
MSMTAYPPSPVAVDARLEHAMRRLVLVGVALVVALPAARGYNPWFGAMPLWLLAMPLVAWWALHRFRLPRVRSAVPVAPRRRRHVAQARRRPSPYPPARLRRAA